MQLHGCSQLLTMCCNGIKRICRFMLYNSCTWCSITVAAVTASQLSSVLLLQGSVFLPPCLLHDHAAAAVQCIGVAEALLLPDCHVPLTCGC
jgi:hypothetical protein